MLTYRYGRLEICPCYLGLSCPPLVTRTEPAPDKFRGSGGAILARHSEAASNATNVVAGREEVMVLLGVNRAWKMNQEKVDVDLAERVVMTPFTAKRLAIMLGATLKAYEAKYGKIEIGIPEAPKG